MQHDNRPFPFDIIDLSHPLSPDMPLWPGDPATERHPHASFVDQGYRLNRWAFGEHTGTHIGAPGHRIEQSRMLDDYPASSLVMPLIVIRLEDIEQGQALSAPSVRDYLSRVEGLPEEACVALETGWADRWPRHERVFETDANGQFLWPGFAPDAITYLANELKVRAVATDAPDIGAGTDRELIAGRVAAEHGLLHIENLANLDQMPQTGGWILIAPLPLEGATGSPARVLGMVQHSKFI